MSKKLTLHAMNDNGGAGEAPVLFEPSLAPLLVIIAKQVARERFNEANDDYEILRGETGGKGEEGERF